MARTLTIFSGLAVVVLTAGLSFLLPSNVDGMQEGFASPIIAFEFATSNQQVYSLFGISVPSGEEASVSACRELTSESSYRIVTLDAVNELDSAYILAYTAFIVFLSMMRFGRGQTRPLMMVAALAIVALVSDVMENIALLGITEALQYCLLWSQERNGPAVIQDWLNILVPFTHIKWAAIPLSFLLMYSAPNPERKVALWLRRACFLFAGLALLLLLLSMMWPGLMHELMAVSVGMCFFTSLLEAFFSGSSSEK